VRVEHDRAALWQTEHDAIGELSGIAVEVFRRPELAAALVAEPDTVLTIIVEIVERGVAAGEIERDRAASIISMFLATTIGLSFQAAIAGQPGLGDAVDGFTRLLEGRLLGDAPAAKSRKGRRSR
jgi:hypothetical protein